jgi:hypothetical protein
MSSGYVLDFTDETFAECFRTVVKVNINDPKYLFGSGSKAKRLRRFWEIESDALVGRVLSEMLDKWKYERDKGGDGKHDATYERCRGIVRKLLGDSAPIGSEEDAFLSRDFGEISVSALPVESVLHPILESRINEALRCMKAGASLAVIFMCGSVLEGALLGVAMRNLKAFNQARTSPKDKQQSVLPLNDWKLFNLIDTATELGFLHEDVKKFSHALREFRNYIHPYQQMSSRFNPDAHTAKICVHVMKAAIASLSGKRQ